MEEDMTKNGDMKGWRGVRYMPLLLAAVVTGTSCSFLTDPPEIPTMARIRVDGSSPHPLALIRSINFVEQVDLDTGQTRVLLMAADTSEVTLPFDESMAVAADGSVYVELLNREVAPASIRLRVDLSPGGESFDRSATMSDNASLVYYYVFF